jgi:2-methylisocitrate lyase-like PEP mutase family enzyme
MATQAQKADLFGKLHIGSNPLVLFNIWDQWSARVVAGAGAKALATSSWAVAAFFGFADGEKLPFEESLSNARRIAQASDLPVTMDIESGYGDTSDAVAKSVAATLDAGLIGCNLEDSNPGSGQLRPLEEQARRIRACRELAESRGLSYFINARTDVFFVRDSKSDDRAKLDGVLIRARAYAEAGASGLFVPGLTHVELLAELCGRTPLPVNVMLTDLNVELAPFKKAGVARISFGPAPYLLAMQSLEKGARAALG